MLDWLVSGGASLIGGLFSMSSQKKRDRANAEAARKANEANEARVNKMNADVRARAERAAAVPIVTNQQTSGSVDVAGMMAGAEAAGFNPVTWLRNGGMQAYAKTSSSSQLWNSQLMDAALAGSTIFQESAPPMQTAQGVGEVIGNALTTGASAWVNEASQERQNQFQMAMLGAQLQGANRSGSGSGRSMYVPTAFLGGSHNTANNSAVLSSKPGDGNFTAWPWMGTPHQLLESEYGEMPEYEGSSRYFRERLLPATVDAIGVPRDHAKEWQPVVDYYNKTLVPSAQAVSRYLKGGWYSDHPQGDPSDFNSWYWN